MVTVSPINTGATRRMRWKPSEATGRYMEYLADISQLSSDALQTAAESFTSKKK